MVRNLLQETLEVMSDNNLSVEDIEWYGKYGQYTGVKYPVSKFNQVLDHNYTPGHNFVDNVIADNLMIKFKNGVSLQRLGGSTEDFECWHFRFEPPMPVLEDPDPDVYELTEQRC